MQEVFLHVHRGLARFHYVGGGGLSGWIFDIARKRCYNAWAQIATR